MRSDERAAQMFADTRVMSKADVGRKWGVSRQRVHQIVSDYVAPSRENQMPSESGTTAVAVVEAPQAQPSHHLVALSQGDLEGAHSQMLTWMRARLAESREELRAAEYNHEEAKRFRWNAKPFDRRAAKLRRQIAFYSKIEAALLAGFVLVPNFDMEVFAIRTRANTPLGSATTRARWANFTQEAQLLPPGEGEYRNPNPLTGQETWKEDDGKGGKIDRWRSWTEGWAEFAYPMTIARPELVTRTGEVLALKLFDEVGIANNTRRYVSRRGDPILLGHFRNPVKGKQGATFFLGWYFDPRAL